MTKSHRMFQHESTARPELDALLKKVADLPPMTAEQKEAQRRSWVIGNLMLDNPDMSREDAEWIYDSAGEDRR